jgi:hypothetical protein
MELNLVEGKAHQLTAALYALAQTLPTIQKNIATTAIISANNSINALFKVR